MAGLVLATYYGLLSYTLYIQETYGPPLPSRINVRCTHMARYTTFYLWLTHVRSGREEDNFKFEFWFLKKEIRFMLSMQTHQPAAGGSRCDPLPLIYVETAT
jgi:hypothetical protein